MAVDLGPGAYDIFARTRAAVTSARYPEAMRYSIAVTGDDGGQPRSDHYRAYCLPAQNVIDVAEISDEQASQPPPVVHGINFALTAFICGGHCETGSARIARPVGPAQPPADLLGVPVLDPTYMFGLAYREHEQPVSPSNQAGLRVITTVSATTRNYDVTLAGTDAVDGAATYHLLLKPLRKPHDNRLRELWVGTGDYLPRRAVIAGNFTIAPLVDVPWTVSFTSIDGAPVIAQEAADKTLYLAHHRVVSEAAIAFEQIDDADSLVDRPLVEPRRDATTLYEPAGSQ